MVDTNREFCFMSVAMNSQDVFQPVFSQAQVFEEWLCTLTPVRPIHLSTFIWESSRRKKILLQTRNVHAAQIVAEVVAAVVVAAAASAAILAATAGAPGTQPMEAGLFSESVARNFVETCCNNRAVETMATSTLRTPASFFLLYGWRTLGSQPCLWLFVSNNYSIKYLPFLCFYPRSRPPPHHHHRRHHRHHHQTFN